MLRLILVILFFLASLLTVFPAPIQFAWFIAVAVSAFWCAFAIVAFFLAVWSFFSKKYTIASVVISLLSLILYAAPVVRAYQLSKGLDTRIENAYGIQPNRILGFHQHSPFRFWTVFSGNGTQKIDPVVYKYASTAGEELHLKFYSSLLSGTRPCMLVVHGGSWKSGSFDELPEMDRYFANAGYQVASINYRLAPKFRSPAPVDDVRSAITWLCNHAADLKIDTTNFVLMGRSAGGQIVLMSAYTLNNPNIKGVASYYGPTDMIWSYENYANRLVLDSRKVQRDFLGGTPAVIRNKYLAASPIEYVTPSTVPTLLVHGTLDAHVSFVQSYRLAKKLDDAHVKNMVLEIPWGTHGCEYNITSPSGQLCIYVTERFFYSVTHQLNEKRRSLGANLH